MKLLILLLFFIQLIYAEGRVPAELSYEKSRSLYKEEMGSREGVLLKFKQDNLMLNSISGTSLRGDITYNKGGYFKDSNLIIDSYGQELFQRSISFVMVPESIIDHQVMFDKLGQFGLVLILSKGKLILSLVAENTFTLSLALKKRKSYNVFFSFDNGHLYLEVSGEKVEIDIEPMSFYQSGIIMGSSYGKSYPYQGVIRNYLDVPVNIDKDDILSEIKKIGIFFD